MLDDRQNNGTSTRGHLRSRWVVLAVAAVCAGVDLAAAAGSAVAADALIPSKSELAFEASTMGTDVEGGFSRFDGKISLQPDNPQASSVSFWVESASLIFSADDVRKELLKPDWLDAARFPKAEFVSTRVRKIDAGHFEVAGTLTIKGHAREVVFPVTVTRSGSATVASGTVPIHRLDFGVGVGEWGDTSVVADEVRIKFRIALGG